MIRMYGIKNCDTMKKAMQWLDDRAIAYTFVDYKKAGVVAEYLPDWSRRAGWETLLNRRGLTWKKLPETERTGVDETQAQALMIAHPTLIKRPVLDTGMALLVGFDPDTYQKALQNHGG